VISRTQISVSALFPEEKLQDYKDVITFENYQSNLTIQETIRLHGIDPLYLNKSSLKVHPHDILVQQPDLEKVEDHNYRVLFRTYPRVFKLDMEILFGDLHFPLTSGFNHRFGVLPYEWLKSYLMTNSDRDIYEQDLVTIENLGQILKIHDEEAIQLGYELINKYIFAVSRIKASWITDITYIDNPFYVQTISG